MAPSVSAKAAVIHLTKCVAMELGEAGIRFERWEAEAPLGADADPEAVLAAYRTSVARVQADGGYGTVDVIRLRKGAPSAAEMRAKFLDEHSHTEDEVRFFVEGSGAFYLRTGVRHGAGPRIHRDPLVQQPNRLGAAVYGRRDRQTFSDLRIT